MAQSFVDMPHNGDSDDIFGGAGAQSPSVDVLGGGLDAFTTTTNGTTTANMRAALQSLLDSKEKQLQQAGTLGQRVLAQQMELEERIRQLQEMQSLSDEHDEPPAELRLHYRELAQTVKAWNEENEKLSSAFSSKQRESGVHPSPILPLSDIAQEAPQHRPSTPSASQSRRAKNAAHRANDVEFAFEIGSSLLTEVRRLQSLLGERDKAIQNMKEEKDDLEKAVESLRIALREQEQNADKFKEENWNLEVSLQEMRSQLTDIQATAQRSDAEAKRLTKALATARELGDSSKNEVERLQRTIEEAKSKHETDIALHRKQAAALAREKSDLQQTVDTYKTELARASRRLPRYGSPLTSDGLSDAQTPRMPEDEDDPFGPGTAGMGVSTNRRRLDTSGLFPPDSFGLDYVDASPDPSPSRPFLSPNHPSNEIEALQQKLAHAQRQINTLKSSLNREKELRMEYKRRMVEAGMQGQRLDGDEEDDEEEVEEVEEVEAKVRQPKLKHRPTPFAGRGRGRGRTLLGSRNGGRTLAQKLIAAQNHPDEDSEEDVLDEGSEQNTSTAVPDTTADEHTGETSMTSVTVSSPLGQTGPKSPSPEPQSSRASVISVEGMDPDFANVLRRAPSLSSASRRTNSFTRSSGRGGRTVTRRRRGGTAYQQPRPSSLVGAPEALAAELGLANISVGMESVKEDEDGPERELKDFACQTETEAVESQAEAHPPAASIRQMADASIQVVAADGAFKSGTSEIAVQVEPEPVVPPKMVETAVQSDAEMTPSPSVIVVAKSDSSMQTIEPMRSDMSIATEPEPVNTSDVVIQTDPVAREPDARLPAAVQPERSEAETQTTPRTAVFPSDLPGFPSSPLAQRRLRYLSSASTVIAMPTRQLRVVQDEDEDEDEDDHTDVAYASAREPETETDTEEYRDARSSAPTPTVTESVNDEDFHSMSTMTDNEFSDEEDDEDTDSIKASVLNMGERVDGRVTPRLEQSAPATPKISYESAAVGTDPQEELNNESQQEPRPEFSEAAIQTDELQLAAGLPPQEPIGFGLYRVGPSSQQFQFIPTGASAPGLASSAPITPLTSTPPVQVLWDTTNTPSARPLLFPSPSLPANGEKSVMTNAGPETTQRQHTQSLSAVSPSVDRSRPPTMMLPPPPKIPPPPNSMPPPSFIPEKRRPTSALSFHRDMPPPRPSSPPPPELIQRATTPVGSALNIPGRGSSSRQHEHASALRQPTSMNSVRSVTSPITHTQMSSASSNAPFLDRRVQSAASLFSDQEDALSRRSSISSDFHHNRALSDEHAGATVLNTPGPMNRIGATSSTDPTIIHAITQTMIGEFLYKYTRRAIGKGHGERRHKRFFWVHPYTKTLYWSSGDPGSTNVTEQSAKSAYIDSVRAVLDPNPMPPGLYQYSIVVSTPQREMKFTAPTKERHEIWLKALNFLLARPTPTAQSPTATQVHGPPVTPVRNPNGKAVSPMSQRSGRTEASGIPNESPWNVTNITPRGARRSRSRVSVAGSIGKRSNTPAAEYLRWSDGTRSPGSPSAHGFELSQDTEVDEELDFEIHDSVMSDREPYEGLENVRACCDGRHTVGRDPGLYEHLHEHGAPHIHKQHSYVHRPIPQFARPEPVEHPTQSSRPSSPAFSFRSRASSRKSGEGSGNLFSRFATRRSKTPVVS